MLRTGPGHSVEQRACHDGLGQEVAAGQAGQGYIQPTGCRLIMCQA